MVTAIRTFTRRFARFNGAFNRTKSKAFIVLYLHKIKGSKQGIDVATIAKIAGVNRPVVNRLLKIGLNGNTLPKSWAYQPKDVLHSSITLLKKLKDM